MLGTDPGIVEPGGDRVRLIDLPVLVHEQIGAIAVQHAGTTAGNRGCVQSGGEPMARRLDAVDLDAGLVEKRVEQAHRIGAAADAGDQQIRQSALGCVQLLAGLAPMIDWKSRTIMG